MRSCVVLLLVILSGTTFQAQQSQTPAVPAGPLTLEQVLELAETRSETVGIARSGIDRARGEQIRARSGLFPQLTAVGNSFFGGGDHDEVYLPFGRKNTWRVNLAFSQNVYSGGRLGAQARIAAVGRESADLARSRLRALREMVRRGRDGAARGAIEAGRVRLRPILMTTFAVIAGMIPVALGVGEGADFRAPLGIAVIGGVITSTILTLLVIPTVYEIFADSRDWFAVRLGRRPRHESGGSTEPVRVTQ